MAANRREIGVCEYPAADAGPSKIPVGAKTANAYRDDMKCSGESYQQQIYEPTGRPHKLAVLSQEAEFATNAGRRDYERP